jgi:hypothetical protein
MAQACRMPLPGNYTLRATLLPGPGMRCTCTLCPTLNPCSCRFHKASPALSLQGDDAGTALPAALPSLEELDLTDNLIAHWGFVARLLQALPSLAALNLSSNRLELPPAPHMAAAPLPPPLPLQLPSLTTLVLNSCDVSWAQVRSFCSRSACLVREVITWTLIAVVGQGAILCVWVCGAGLLKESCRPFEQCAEGSTVWHCCLFLYWCLQ